MIVGIIGAGIAGLACAGRLMRAGHEVVVLEKSRGVGGRMATRRLDTGVTFDHGAQYFTARHPDFQQQVAAWMEQGLVQQWPVGKDGSGTRFAVLNPKQGAAEEGHVHQRFVGVPTMNSVCKFLSTGLDVRANRRVVGIRPFPDRMAIDIENESGPLWVDRLVTTAPAGQSAGLLATFADLSARLSQVQMLPCWATMALFSESIDVPWSGAFVNDSLLSWVARNGSKPGHQTTGESLVMHASTSWTSEFWERPAEDAARIMLEEFWRVAECRVQSPVHLLAHRWRYALPSAGSPVSGPLHDDSQRVVACGDWAEGSRVEGAFISGCKAADLLLKT